MFLLFLLSLCISDLEVSGDENGNKRLLINDQDAIIAKLNALSSKMEELEKENTILKQRMDTMKKSGTTYIRWGRKDCPGVNGTYLLYSGIAGGGSYRETGSGTNFVCLPHDPDFAPPDFPVSLDSLSESARIWGAEYQFSYGNVKVDDDVPCALCVDTLSTTSIMIAAKTACPSQWRKHYSGFLSANYYSHPAASEYACVDEDPQYFEGRRSNMDGKLFFPVMTVCGSLPCPPYENSKYLKCVVCSN